jgi:hypothetical protein
MSEPRESGAEPQFEGRNQAGTEEQEENLSQQEVPGAEAQLSPEVIEIIMAKIADIDKKGTAYTRVTVFGSHNYGQEQFYSRLTQGFDTLDEIEIFRKRESEFINQVENQRTAEGLAVVGKILAEGVCGRIKDNKKNLVYFNIVGRSIDTWHEEPMSTMEIDKSYHSGRDGSVTLIFDVTGMNELPPGHALKEEGLENRDAYRSDSPEMVDIWKGLIKKHPGLKLGDDILKNYAPRGEHNESFDENGFPIQDPEFGFVLSGGVPLEKFKGIVLKGDKKHLEEWVASLVNLIEEKCANKPENILPIYDTQGNLWWSKQMSYEEVKKFVAERDSGKSEKPGIGY